MISDGQRITFVLSRGDDLAKYMQDVLDEKWQELRGFQVESVAIASISYDEESQKLINMRNQGAMLSDASIREGYVQGSIARGLESAGSNEAGAGQGFFGMGVGMSTMGSGFGTFSQNNAEQIRQQQAQQASQSQPAPNPDAAENHAGAETVMAGVATSTWTCPQCGITNTGKFCSECGTKKPDASLKCPKCGNPVSPQSRFCPECGQKLQSEPPSEASDAKTTDEQE